MNNQIDEYHETISSGHSPYQETKYQESFTKFIKKQERFTEFIKKQERFPEFIKKQDTKDNKERKPPLLSLLLPLKERIPIKTKTDEKGCKDDIDGIQTWRPWIKKEGDTTQSTDDKTKVIPKVIPYETIASAIRTASFVSHCCGQSNTINLDETLPLNCIRCKCRCDQSAPIYIKKPYQINKMKRIGRIRDN